MFKYVMLSLVIFMVGCESDHPENWTASSHSGKLTVKGLEDCTVFDLNNNVKITRCPASITTTTYQKSCGKNCTHTYNNTVDSPEIVVQEVPQPTQCVTDKIYTKEEADQLCVAKLSKAIGLSPTK